VTDQKSKERHKMVLASSRTDYVRSTLSSRVSCPAHRFLSSTSLLIFLSGRPLIKHLQEFQYLNANFTWTISEQAGIIKYSQSISGGAPIMSQTKFK